jgi:pectinesterase
VYENTLYSNRETQCFHACRIDGHADDIFGNGTAWFEQCEIHSLKNGYITAATTPKEKNKHMALYFTGAN